MVVVFANNQPLVAQNGTNTVITTDPVQVSPTQALLQLTTNIHILFAMGSSTGGSLSVKMQGSNDGQTFQDISGLATTDTAVGQSQASVTAPFAFVRAEFSFAESGGASPTADWAYVVFDVHLNFASP